MFSNIKKLIIALSCAATLLGCASQDTQQQELALKADRRAGILASSLPIEYGPLTITKASSRDNTVIIEMLYNQAGQKPASQLASSAKNYYCTTEELKTSIDEGINYLIKIRNNRGKLVVEEMITQQTCSSSAQ